MHIFIDESGTFTGIGAGAPAVSTIGALILTSHSLSKLFRKYERLRINLPKNGKGEVKGSKLNETQVAAVVELLRKNGAIFCASMIDLAGHTTDDIAAHRNRRSASLAANITDGHTQELRDSVAALQARMAGFPDQLYVQGAVTIDLLYRNMQDMIMYHCQRFPKELAEFHWIIDAKAPAVVTDWEDWWSKTLVIWLQAMSLERPGAMLPGGDYRHFRRFILAELPAYLRDVAPPGDRAYGAGVDLQLMYGESFRFSSEPEPGLELVDIVTNALRRGLAGNLGEEGWLPLRSLMIHRRDVYVSPVGLISDDNRKLAQSLLPVMNKFRTGGRIMATRGLQWPDEVLRDR
ncbi:hypothetical protein [Burkholderia cepacia]|uniref:hypothetical protein n=1 Tax=Burkholderia cepacia TaxID=292 RepID=UPI0029901EC1|nr:hypothetical protein [Burkholderia cepacia]